MKWAKFECYLAVPDDFDGTGMGGNVVTRMAEAVAPFVGATHVDGMSLVLAPRSTMRPNATPVEGRAG